MAVTFERSETVRLRAEVRDPEDNALFDPVTSMKITIKDSAGALKADDLDMTKESQGVYRYYYDLLEADALGIWQVAYHATDGSVITIQRDIFRVSD